MSEPPEPRRESPQRRRESPERRRESPERRREFTERRREPAERTTEREGLCPVCVHVRRVVSSRGSTFLRCRLADRDPALPRYPPQPRMVCRGFAR